MNNVFVNSTQTAENVCTAQYTRQVDPGKTHDIHISNTLKSLRVVGNNPNSNALRSSILSVQTGTTLEQIEPSCFINCSALKNVNLAYTCKYIGDSAFKNCTALEYVNIFDDGEIPVNNIGAHAFDGCESLDRICLTLSSSYVNTGLGEYCFANCTNLKEFTQKSSSYLAPYMLAGCTSLTSISLPQNTNYVYEYALAEIPNIEQINLPNNIWFMSEGMFKNDKSLTAVNIQDTIANKSVMNMIESSVFDGCDKLTSITLPESIDSLTCLNQTWLSGSSISVVYFNGIPDDQFQTSASVQTKINAIDSYGYVSTKANFKNVVTLIRDKHIPAVIITQKNSMKVGDANTGCSHCTRLWRMLTGSKWKQFMSSNQNKFLFIFAAFNVNDEFWKWFNLPTTEGKNNPLAKWCTYSTTNMFAQMHLLWIKPDGETYAGTTLKWDDTTINESKRIQDTIDIINKKFSDSTETFGNDEITYIQNVNLDKFGSDLEYVTFVSKTGHSYKITKDTEVVYQPEVRVNKDMRDNFQYGLWYYNIKELKEFADKYNIPLFFEFGDRGCDPCKIFKNKIFNNTNFQNFVNDSPYLYCKLETTINTEYSDPNLNPEAYYIFNTLAKGAKNYTNQQIPIVGFYWKKYGITEPVVWEVSSYHFNAKAAGATPPFTMEELTSDISAKFGSYTRNSRFNQIPISTLYSDQGVIVGKVYDNVGDIYDDPNGIYFACDEKEDCGDERFDKTINISGYTPPFPTYVQKGQIIQFKPATYQYYSTASSQSYNYDKQGCIFRVDISGSNNVVSYVHEFKNDYDEGERPNQYFFNNWYDLSAAADVDLFNNIVKEAEDIDARMIIVKSNYTSASNELDDKMNNDEFLDFMSELSTPETYYVRIKTSQWDQGMGLALSTFINTDFRSVDDRGKSWTWDDTAPKIYLYQGCKSCTAGPNPDIVVTDQVDPVDKTIAQIITDINNELQYF